MGQTKHKNTNKKGQTKKSKATNSNHKQTAK